MLRREIKEIIIIFLCWLVYVSAYLGKYSYTTNTAVIGPFYGVTKADVGFVSSVFFVAYGIGQVVNAIFCKYYPKKLIIALALIVSAIINLALFFDIPFNCIKYLWFINAVAQSVLWPTLVQIISTYVSKQKMKIAVLTMATAVATGTILSYLLSALFVHIGNFKITFLVTSIYLAIISLCWLIVFGSTTKNMGHAINEDMPENEIESESIPITKEGKKIIDISFYITLVCLIIFAIVNNFVKDGLNTWVPNILKELYFLPDSLSMVLTITLSIFGIFSAWLATSLHRYVKDFVVMCGILFLLSCILVAGVIGLFNTNLWIMVLLCFGFISLLMHAINNVITSMFALYMPNNSNAGLFAGLLNGACYVGSALSSYGLGAFADSFGWINVFYLLLICCIASIIISLIYALINILSKRKSK